MSDDLSAPGAALDTAFRPRNLSRLCYANAFTLWHYRSHNLRLAILTARGFFADAHSLLKAGDGLILVGTDAAALFMVSVAEAGVVSIVPFSSGGL